MRGRRIAQLAISTYGNFALAQAFSEPADFLQFILYERADRLLNFRRAYARRENQANCHRPRIVQRASDLAAQPHIDFLYSLDARVNSIRNLIAQQVVDLADVADRILAGGRFHGHGSIQADHAVDSVAASDFASVRSFGRRSQDRKIHPACPAGRIVERIKLQLDSIQFLQLRLTFTAKAFILPAYTPPVSCVKYTIPICSMTPVNGGGIWPSKRFRSGMQLYLS